MNYWLKAFTTTHEGISVAVTELINKQTPIPTRLLEGRCGLHRKKLQPKAPDHRPITCLITMYKSITSLVGEYLPLKTLPMDQRGGRPGVMGCTDNMLIDKMILEDAKMNKKKLSMVWADVRKAFDSVTHTWILKVLSMNKTNKRIIKFVENIMKGWKISITVDTVNGKEQLEPINVKRGILQGDSFVVKLFVL